jgi:co-chaperonin GroES (HSP10)
VFFGRYSGKEIKQDLDTQTYGDYESILIMVEDDILCKVKEA